ncbi:biopolymer transporter ExbD [Advenella sp. S44]|uniref:MotA/TolQ/ExbB proton channel family protein n=1 Tax=Advenella sp. S44 TaxID=1982755 RepID=UPI000C2B0A9A|nr:MotA/TolQ/ExbB proton channel family protein [Advenella sp. S44]PJX26107.1 biopolymer transporter ExbD [Advenella sp. S44]
MDFFANIEQLLYAVSRVFLMPILFLIVLSLLYAVAMLGAFLVEGWQRRGQGSADRLVMQARHYLQRQVITSADLELYILKRLEWLRIVSRTAPMLGLIATMIPMGPALLALGNGDATEVGKNMVAAFSAVILALLAASLCFFILIIRRRWLLQDLHQAERSMLSQEESA